MAKGKFVGGMSTKPEVRRLLDLNAEPGSVIQYDEIESMLGLSRRDNRWKSVISAWRKHLFNNHRYRVKPEINAFRVLTADETVGENANEMHRAGRAAGRVVVHVEATDTTSLSKRALDRHTLLRRESHALLSAAQNACRAIEPPRAKRSDNIRLAPSE